MSIAEKIVEQVKALPESAQTEVLDFVEFLKAKGSNISAEDADWSKLSVDLAMRGMENEPFPYTERDLKEVFS